MKIVLKKLKPRNFVAVRAILKNSAGAHKKSNKALRRDDNVKHKREIND